MLRNLLIFVLLSATAAHAAPALEGTVQPMESKTRFLLLRTNSAPQPIEFPFAARLEKGWLVRVEEPTAQADGSLLADRVMRIATPSSPAALQKANIPPPVLLPDATLQAAPYQPVHSQAELDALLPPPPARSQKPAVATNPKAIAEKPVKPAAVPTAPKADDAFSAEAYRAQVKARMVAATPPAQPAAIPPKQSKPEAKSLFGPGDKRRR